MPSKEATKAPPKAHLTASAQKHKDEKKAAKAERKAQRLVDAQNAEEARIIEEARLKAEAEAAEKARLAAIEAAKDCLCLEWFPFNKINGSTKKCTCKKKLEPLLARGGGDFPGRAETAPCLADPRASSSFSIGPSQTEGGFSQTFTNGFMASPSGSIMEMAPMKIRSPFEEQNKGTSPGISQTLADADLLHFEAALQKTEASMGRPFTNSGSAMGHLQRSQTAGSFSQTFTNGGSIFGTKARAKNLSEEFKGLGLASLPSCQRLHSVDQGESLLRAQESGDLDSMRVAIRGARTQLGLEAPVVVKVGKMLSRAERCVRSCRDCLKKVELPEWSFLELPATMQELEEAVGVARKLPLGPGLWQEPMLAFSNDLVKQWWIHKPAVEELVKKFKKGPAAFCAAWANMAINDSELKLHFGRHITKGLALLQAAGAGVHLVYALQETFQTVEPDNCEILHREFAEGTHDCPEGVLLPGYPDPYELTILRIMRTSDLLATLDKPAVDLLLLKCNEDGPLKGKCGLWEAATLQDTTVFLAMYQALTCQRLQISQKLQKKLERPSTDPIEQGLPASRLAAERLGELLDTRATHLRPERFPAAGSEVRLFPETGEQPSSEEAQEMLGKAAATPAELVRAREVDRWLRTEDPQCTRRPTANAPNRRIYDEILLCRRTRAKMTAEIMVLHVATVKDQDARDESALADFEFARCDTWLPLAEQEKKDAQAAVLITMRASSVAIMDEDGVDEDGSIAAEAKRLDNEAEERHTASKVDLAAAIEAHALATIWRDNAAAALPPAAGSLAVAEASEKKVEAKFVLAHAKYTATLQGPRTPLPADYPAIS